MIRGLRVHIAGSASANCDRDLLDAAHQYVRAVSAELIARGAGLLVGAGGEPLGEAGLACIFDWTVIETIAGASDPGSGWPLARPDRFVVVVTQRALEKIPENRRDPWTKCRKRPDLDLETTPPGWRFAGILRERQMVRGDVLLVLGGGAGVEHLAEIYCEDGKPVVAIHSELGAFSEDGKGGGRFLHERALSDVAPFFRLRDGSGSAAGRLSGLRLTAGRDPVQLAKDTADLLDDLQPRTAFYVRLLNSVHPDFVDVESFFRDVVDGVVTAGGFSPREIGRGRPETAFMNVEIFETLHRAGLVIVDLTGVRPNCMMELGYALGRRRRVILSARTGTELPFDEDKLPTHLWDSSRPLDSRIREYRDWFDRYNDLPPLVKPLR
jgi:hypothetical protein